MTSRWPEEERGGGETENPDLLDRISLGGSRGILDGSRESLDGSRGSLDGSRLSLDGLRGTQTDSDRQLEVTQMMSGEMVLVLMMSNFYPQKICKSIQTCLTAKEMTFINNP